MHWIWPLCSPRSFLAKRIKPSLWICCCIFFAFVCVRVSHLSTSLFRHIYCFLLLLYLSILWLFYKNILNHLSVSVLIKTLMQFHLSALCTTAFCFTYWRVGYLRECNYCMLIMLVFLYNLYSSTCLVFFQMATGAGARPVLRPGAKARYPGVSLWWQGSKSGRHY